MFLIMRYFAILLLYEMLVNDQFLIWHRQNMARLSSLATKLEPNKKQHHMEI